ncbi:hypothetical protein BD324DRAFT_647991 [Kockovaella imperatae]|uniref:Uncharacterized protein n=1 Tax=Kockovaella imperatae TaxID=4999 RepID=A0A1Y1UV52_9TREE|nr:hypothetical protein BD324DRAFT_647991 [Kockovaella imperatae]ORX41095.1 hypothetical protein BD324DRAFT_647991 [Kockovaella imperatae]
MISQRTSVPFSAVSLSTDDVFISRETLRDMMRPSGPFNLFGQQLGAAAPISSRPTRASSSSWASVSPEHLGQMAPSGLVREMRVNRRVGLIDRPQPVEMRRVWGAVDLSHGTLQSAPANLGVATGQHQTLLDPLRVQARLGKRKALRRLSRPNSAGDMTIGGVKKARQSGHLLGERLAREYQTTSHAFVLSDPLNIVLGQGSNICPSTSGSATLSESHSSSPADVPPSPLLPSIPHFDPIIWGDEREVSNPPDDLSRVHSEELPPADVASPSMTGFKALRPSIGLLCEGQISEDERVSRMKNCRLDSGLGLGIFLEDN